MASDNINQVGKSIRRIKEDASYATKKVFLNRRIERSRDVFDTTVPFEMEFRTNRPDDKVTLDLKFNKPPPRKGCTADCFSNFCETFSFDFGGDHLIQVSTEYIPLSPVVFRNREKLSPVNYVETDPLNGLIYVQGTTAGDEITVCFVTGDCVDDGCTCPPPPDFTVLLEGQSLGQMFVTSTPAQPNFVNIVRSGGNVPPGYVRVYAGATYRTIYTCSWGPTANLLNVGLDQWPAGSNALGNITMGFPGNQTFYAEQVVTSLATFDADLVLAQTNGTVANSLAGSSASCIVVYISGPDPRFQGITPSDCRSCIGRRVVNDQPVQTIVNGVWRVSSPYQIGTLSGTVNGISVVITEHNPSAGTFLFAVQPHITDDIRMSYIAA